MARCTSCGAERDPGTQFCRRCGASVGTENATTGLARGPIAQVVVPPVMEDTAHGSDKGPRSGGARAHGPGWYAFLTGGLAVLVGVMVIGGMALVGGLAGGEGSDPDQTFPTGSVQAEDPPTTPTPTPTTTSQRPPKTSSPPSPVGNDVVAVAAQAAENPDAPLVVDVLTAYFVSINDRDFVTLRSLFTSAIQADLSLEGLAEGYRSTYDSDVLLRQIQPLADGRVAAWVDFVSTQDAVDGPDGQTCTFWSIALFLEVEGSRVVIGSPPAEYRASYEAC